MTSMDLKTYKKTRYQNIYRHYKNNNYIIRTTNPETSISKIEGNKIFNLEDAKRIRDDYSLHIVKSSQKVSKYTFESIWNKYVYDCENARKLSYNTIKKKKLFYLSRFNYFYTKKVNKIEKNEIIEFIKKLNTTEKEKNEILVCLKGFFNWCMTNNYISISPTYGIKEFRVTKTEMKYWTKEEIKSFFDCVNENLNINKDRSKYNLYALKIFCLIECNLGDRVGETRSLRWCDIDYIKNIVHIKHSINYNTKDNTFISNTKNYQSQRDLDVSEKLIDALKEYKKYLVYEYGLSIENDYPIIMNPESYKPYSDTTIRKLFYKYSELAHISKIRPYDLRHTYVTLLMSEKFELYHISKRLGHKNYSTTVDKYGHVSEKIRKEISESINKFL
jgi:integrase